MEKYFKIIIIFNIAIFVFLALVKFNEIYWNIDFIQVIGGVFYEFLILPIFAFLGFSLVYLIMMLFKKVPLQRILILLLVMALNVYIIGYPEW